MYRVFIYQTIEDFMLETSDVIILEFGDVDSAMNMAEDLIRSGVAVCVGRVKEDE